jgi:hypothetical protein
MKPNSARSYTDEVHVAVNRNFSIKLFHFSKRDCLLKKSRDLSFYFFFVLISTRIRHPGDPIFKFKRKTVATSPYTVRGRNFPVVFLPHVRSGKISHHKKFSSQTHERVFRGAINQTYNTYAYTPIRTLTDPC